MPMLQFRCTTCGEKFEELVRSTGDDSLSCPHCGGQEVVRAYEGRCTFGALKHVQSTHCGEQMCCNGCCAQRC